MPTIIPRIPFIRRRKPGAATQAATAPTLVAAAFGVDDGAFVTLTFDRAVAVDGFDSASVSVEQQVLESVYVASSAVLLDPVTVKVELFADAPCPAGPDVLLTAGADNGIVAAEGGEPWAGVSDVELPFP